MFNIKVNFPTAGTHLAPGILETGNKMNKKTPALQADHVAAETESKHLKCQQGWWALWEENRAE